MVSAQKLALITTLLENNMHTGPSEASLLKEILKKEVEQNAFRKEKLEQLLSDLNVGCDISKDRTWNHQFYCKVHDLTYHYNQEAGICPVGQFAKDLKKKHE